MQTDRQVTKLDGSLQAFSQEKIATRINNLLDGLETEHMRIDAMIEKVVKYAHNSKSNNVTFADITTKELDNLLAETAAYMNMVHPDCGRLGARIAVTGLHKRTEPLFKDVIDILYNYTDNGVKASLIAEDVYQLVQQHHEKLQEAIDYKKDLDYDYFGYKTLEKGYLLKVHGKTVERPQSMIMRVALGIHKADIDSAIETYRLMADRFFTHATPTLFNAGTPKPQMSSCFLLAMKDDSIEGIYSTLHQTALISKSAGGIGLSVHNIRAGGSYIKGTNGNSNGLVPMLKVFNETARYVDQGGGKRKGSFAIYLEPWHADIYEFLQLKKNHGKEENRARDLFYALWVPDLFMKRVMEDGEWTLFCPNKCPGLHEVHSEEFEKLYLGYEAAGKGNQTVKAQQLWQTIIESQIETGTPYMLFKDHANRKSNQQNLGTIKSSNLCCEIVEYTSKDEVAVCNLASLALPKYVKADGTYDHEKLHQVARLVTKNLNRIIDGNYYPIPEAKNSNMRHRPIGIGVQGLADALILMKIAYEDEAAEKLNAEIFETIYHAAMTESVELAKVEGHYETFKGSPLSEGKFQFDLWGEKPASDRYDWDALRTDVMKYGARNSLLLAPMPTASTAQIMGNNESFEPYTTNIYTRRVLSGEFICVNPHLVRDMISLGIWDNESRN